MHVEREHDRIRLSPNPLEAQIVEQVLRSVIKHYQLEPSQLDTKTAAAWYSTGGCKSSGMSEEETKDWVDSLHSLKTSQLSRLEEWAGKLAARQTAPVHLELSFNEATSFITILNDYRLFLAAQHNIGQREMDLHSVRALQELPAPQQGAICQIDFVGWLMDDLLRLVAPEASRWRQDAEE